MDTKVTYKGLPLVRNNNEIYYGDPSKEYIVYLNVVSTRQVDGQEIADKV